MMLTLKCPGCKHSGLPGFCHFADMKLPVCSDLFSFVPSTGSGTALVCHEKVPKKVFVWSCELEKPRGTFMPFLACLA